MIVVTADHGVVLTDGRFDRRRASRETVDEIAPVPLFVKKPGQRRGRIDDSVVETTDVVPTILDVLGVDRPKDMDGRSAFSREVEDRDEVKVFERSLEDTIRLSSEDFDAERQEALEAKLRLFGTGADPPERIYRVGPNLRLLGREAADLDRARTRPGRRASSTPAPSPTWTRRGPLLPNWIVGRVSGGEAPSATSPSR